MKITYLMNEFPVLTENFIIYEIDGLLKRHVDIRVLSLAKPADERFSDIPEKSGFAHIIKYARQFNNEKLHGIYSLFWLLRLACKGRFSAISKILKDKSQLGIYPRFHLLRIAHQIEICHPGSDILFCHFGPLGKLGASLKYYGLIKHKLITSYHGYDLSRYIKTHGEDAYENLFKYADKLLFVSDYFRKKAISLGATAEKTEVVHTAIDCQLFSYQPRQYPQEPVFRFITVGRLTPKKDHASLVKVFARLIEANPQRQLSLKIIGAGPDQALISEAIHSSNVAEQVQLLGAMQHADVLKQLNQSDIFVLNCVTADDGDEEGIPGSLMEAMALGMPVVSTDHTGVPELVEHLQSGLIAQEKNNETLLAMLQTILDRPELWPLFSQRGRQKVESDFERNKESDKLLAILHKLNRQ